VITNDDSAQLSRLLELREHAKARQVIAGEAHDQDTVLVMNMVQDTINAELIGESQPQVLSYRPRLEGGELFMDPWICDNVHISLRPREADAESGLFYTIEFCSAVVDMTDYTAPLEDSIYQGLYLGQARSQLVSDLRALRDGDAPETLTMFVDGQYQVEEVAAA
jgi:hypothetical protein